MKSEIDRLTSQDPLLLIARANLSNALIKNIVKHISNFFQSARLRSLLILF